MQASDAASIDIIGEEISANTWYWVVGLWDTPTSRLLVDDVQQGTSAATLGIANEGTLKIGSGPSDTTGSFIGNIGGIGIWPRTLTTAELAIAKEALDPR